MNCSHHHFCLKDCSSLEQKEIFGPRRLINAIKCPAKRQDLFEQFKIELDVSVAAPLGITVDIRWSSTFNELKGTCCGKTVLNAVAYQIPQLRSSVMSDWGWLVFHKIINLQLACWAIETHIKPVIFLWNKESFLVSNVVWTARGKIL